MRAPAIPDDEAERLEALRRLRVLDTPSEERFDRLTRLARAIFKVPMALVSLVDGDRQWFKSRQGLDACETPRDVSFCGHAILSPEILHVPNATEDPRFAANPLVTGAPNIRFYAGAPLSTPDGHRVGTLCIIDDRERRLTDDELRSLRDLADCVQEELGKAEMQALVKVVSHHETRLRAVLNTVNDGIIAIDDQGVIQKANPATERLFGYAAGEMLGRNVNMLMPEPYRSEHDGYMRRYLATGEARIIGIGREVTGRRKDGTTFPLELAVTETRVGGERYFVGVVRDVSERKEAERALIAAKEQAEESNRMKSEFLNMMSHELRTPLTVVLGYLPLLRDAAAMPPPEMIADMVGDMRQAGDHLLHLINDLLDLSKIEAGKMELKRERLELEEIVGGVLNDLRREAEAKGLALVSRVDETEVEGDRVRLRQILINLVGNAVKFTERGMISVVSRPLAGGVEVRVADTGIGIPEKDLPVIFDRFRQVDSSSTRKAGGTGLGLAITKKLVELHGGTITVASRPGEGTVFTFSLMNEGDERAAPRPPEVTDEQ